MVATDHFAVFFVLVLLAAAGLGVLLSFVYLRRSGEYRAEYYTLLLLATAGMTLLVAAVDLILVFLALELLSLSLYLLTGFSFRRIASSEASMKYFLLGAFSSRVLPVRDRVRVRGVGLDQPAGARPGAGRRGHAPSR